jgi:CHAT domain-containing protein
VATHGFFVSVNVFDEPRAGQADSLDNLLNRTEAARRYPALLSGLALSGANLPEEEVPGKPADCADGLLTAEEIGAQRLSGVELVVLSACESGLGWQAGSEGVLGLQRYFQAAGARTVVASLWRVYDKATQTLMVEFYKNLWEKKLGKLEALRQAQLSVLHGYDRTTGQLRGPDFSRTESLPTGSATKKPASDAHEPLPPAYWAAFVLSGDWR